MIREELKPQMRPKTTRFRCWGLPSVVACCALMASGCGSAADQTDSKPSAAKTPSTAEKPVGHSRLRSLLLAPSDLGAGYTQAPAEDQGSERYDDIGLSGCPALEKLGKQSDQMQFASKAAINFSYDTDSTLGEELHSDAPSTLSTKLRTLFRAYTACPSYEMTSGSTPIEVKITRSSLPRVGDEQFGYTTTLKFPHGSQVLKTVAVREKNVAVMLVGAPALVDRNIDQAVGKVSSGS
ncbi:hypothetical protein ABZW18_32665 [Streptomyces sp. NPDC004647]|uniref:hypothetical protein n=1 Tax=Streptomyces sp. NPDC004647 TaxID=3154671 RepID=UPI0033B56FDC